MQGGDAHQSYAEPTWIILLMRINLVTPFAEKDAVKALGARWDASKKRWYIVDVTDLSPFLRWIPNMEAAVAQQSSTPSKPTVSPSASFSVPQANDVADCGCDVLPWDHCLHTAKS